MKKYAMILSVALILTLSACTRQIETSNSSNSSAPPASTDSTSQQGQNSDASAGSTESSDEPLYEPTSLLSISTKEITDTVIADSLDSATLPDIEKSLIVTNESSLESQGKLLNTSIPLSDTVILEITEDLNTNKAFQITLALYAAEGEIKTADTAIFDYYLKSLLKMTDGDAESVLTELDYPDMQTMDLGSAVESQYMGDGAEFYFNFLPEQAIIFTIAAK